LKLKIAEPLSKIAFNLKLRQYSAAGEHRVVLEEELRGTSGRVLFNGRYIPTVTTAIPGDNARTAGADYLCEPAMAAWPTPRSLSSST
jgi:hypothetical protein